MDYDSAGSAGGGGRSSQVIVEPKPHDILEHPAHPKTEEHKKVEMTLVWYPIGSYQIKSIKNTTYYTPGQWMTKGVAQQCCDVPGWDVTMVDNELLKTILGAFGGLGGAISGLGVTV